MIQLILRYTGAGRMPADDLERLRALKDLHILQESGRMVLLETAQQHAGKLAELFPDWITAPVVHEVEIPDPAPKPNKPPRA